MFASVGLVMVLFVLWFCFVWIYVAWLLLVIVICLLVVVVFCDLAGLG